MKILITSKKEKNNAVSKKLFKRLIKRASRPVPKAQDKQTYHEIRLTIRHAVL
jgi:hypothetical protein